MQNKQVKNLKVLGASLCLGATLLTGCGKEKISIGSSDIIIEEGKSQGTIFYTDLEQNIRIVHFQQDGNSEYRLLIKRISKPETKYSLKPFKSTLYFDLETGSCIISYIEYDLDDIITYVIGKNIKIVEERSIVPYLISKGFIKSEYTVEELLAFFQEKVLPTLENTNKELVK